MEALVMVERPLKVELVEPAASKNSDDSTNFPSDEADFADRNRNRSFRTHIDDLVNRHPELAEYLNFDQKFDRFPSRSNTWGHRRRGSSSSGDESNKASGSKEFPDHRRFNRPFGTHLEDRFGFPFSRTFDAEPEYYRESQPQQHEEQKPPQVPTTSRGRKQNPHIPQSSTVDLGQKQDPVLDTRGQRSMSAPPENRAGQQRFVTSVNIPMNSEGGGADTNSQQQAPQHNKSHERVIPIHVEGRDEPVIPKNASKTFSQTPPQPQAERGFGQRPTGFSQWSRAESPYYATEPQYYVNRTEPQQQQQRPNAEQYHTGSFKQQQKPQQQRQTPPPPQQQQQQQPPPPPQQQREQTPPPQPPPSKLGPIEQIKCIQKDVLDLMTQVEQFNGKPKDKQYLFLDEMLTRNLLKLDDVETDGKENIRQARKEAINCIQRCINILEAKAMANEQLRSQLMMAVAAPSNDTAVASLASLEVGGKTRTGVENVSDVKEDSTPMEVEAPVSTEKEDAIAKVPIETIGNVEVQKEEMSEPTPPIESCSETKEDGTKDDNSEQSIQESTTSQSNVDVPKEEVKEKKDKKKVKKKEKPDENDAQK